MSEDSVARLERNPWRILDSKDPDDRGICHAAPVIDDYLSGEAQDFFSAVTAGLDAAGVAWDRNARLVRGLDYYRHTAFEFVTDRLGAQGTVLGGGRYDGLIENLGGPATPAVGWAAGIERLAMLVDAPVISSSELAIVLETDQLTAVGLWLVSTIRRSGYSAELITSGSVRKRFDKAVKQSPKAILVLNDHLLDDGAIANLRLKVLDLKPDGNGIALYSKVGEIVNARFDTPGWTSWVDDQVISLRSKNV